MRMKRVWVLVMALVLVTGAVAFGQDKPMTGWTVGYLPGSLVDALRITWSKYLQTTVEAAGGKVIVIDSQNDATKQVSDGEDILQKKINILVINPIDSAAMIPIVDKANSMKIPVVCIDRTVDKGDIVTTVEFDNWKAGNDAGEFIAKALGGKGEVMQIQGTLGASVVYERGESYRKAIAKYPGLKIVAEPSSKDWTTQDALAFTEDALSAHPNLKAIWCHADAIALGAFNAVQAKGKEKQVIVVGMGMYSGVPEIIKAGTGKVYTWALLPEEVGRATGNVCIKIAKKQLSQIRKITLTPLIWVGKENIEANWKYKLD
jgi:ribose transport system substrate-binding protein